MLKALRNRVRNCRMILASRIFGSDMRGLAILGWHFLLQRSRRRRNRLASPRIWSWVRRQQDLMVEIQPGGAILRLLTVLVPFQWNFESFDWANFFLKQKASLGISSLKGGRKVPVGYLLPTLGNAHGARYIRLRMAKIGSGLRSCTQFVLCFKQNLVLVSRSPNNISLPKFPQAFLFILGFA